MTGIMAIVSLDGRPVPPELARAQLAAIAHRGEWEPRLWEAPGIAMGHVNLPRTPEAEREFLPASEATGRYWVTWDGRLDNREELAGLLHLGHEQAREMTDADYVLAAYQQWADECVHKLLGDWAIVIWDSRNRKLFCAKDPLGWRQLYYAELDGLLAVGSEPQQLFAGGWLPREVNTEFVLRFLADALQEPGETCYLGVRELWGGQSAAAVDGRIAANTFWRSPARRKRSYSRPQEYVDEFVNLFDRAVGARLRTNRPVGVFLSGGIDSSYITAIAAPKAPGILALTAHAPKTKWMDERTHAEVVASHTFVRNEQIDISDCWSLSHHQLPGSSFDQPDQPAQGATHVRLASAAREHGLGVVMGGEGADEWMTGVPTVAGALVAMKPLSAWKIAAASKSSTPRAFVKGAFRGLAPTSWRKLARSVRGGGGGFFPFTNVSPKWHSVSPTEQPPAWQPGAVAERNWHIYHQSAGSVVGWRDRNAFAPNSIELRTPFNDLRIVELMAATPEWVKQFRGRRKDILREAEYPVLPRSIPDRVDFGLYTELVDVGVSLREADRVSLAIRCIGSVPGINRERVTTEVERWVTSGHQWWEPNWRAITTGLWLANLGAQHSTTSTMTPRVLGNRISNGEEVICNEEDL